MTQDRPIQAGDLVIITKQTVCCKSNAGVGMIFRVAVMENGYAKCNSCGYIHHQPEMRAFASDDSGALCSRLTRIPGLGELAKVSYKEPIRIPEYSTGYRE